VRVDDEDAPGADRPPVGDVVLGEAARLLDVAHLRRRPAAAPLLGHEAELHARRLEDAGDRARQRRAVEGGLAVAEEDGVAADRQAQPVGPVRHPLLRDRCAVQHRLVPARVRELVPLLPARLVDAGVDRERPHRLHQVHRAGAEAVEVAGEERVGAAQLARAALGAVDVVAGDVLDAEHALLHADHIGVERRGRVRLVPGDLHHRAHLTAELVARAETVVRGRPPLLDEFLRRAVDGPLGRPWLLHVSPSGAKPCA
jgi:hypothetical protein